MLSFNNINSDVSSYHLLTDPDYLPGTVFDCVSSHSRYCPYSTVKETDSAYFFNGSA